MLKKIRKTGFLKLLWWRNPLLMFVSTLSSNSNHKRIKRALAINPDIGLRPLAPLFEGGSVEHYYHFLFDLVFPVLEITGQQKAVRIVTGTPLAPIAKDLFGDRIKFIDPKGQCRVDTMDLRGMNPRVYRIDKRQILNFQNFISEWMIGKPVAQACDLLLIERSLPPDYYLSDQCSVKGGGSLRRSIANHTEISDDLRILVETGMLPGIKTIRNVKLEGMPFHEQIQLFASAKLIVGQHGAGLSNIVFCKPGTHLVEINDRRECRHFMLLSKVAGVRHSFLWVVSPHPVVAKEQIRQLIQNLAIP
jgi:hypothetical protein